MFEPTRILLAAALCGVPAVAASQPARADSVARADSIARADSVLLQQELARIRGDRRRTARDSGTTGQPPATERRTPRFAPRLRVGLVLGTGSAWAEDEAGVTVGSGAVAGLALEGGWTAGRAYALGLGVRATTTGISIEEEGASRSGGRATQVDLTGSVERAVADRVGLRVAGGAAWILGPEAIVPFGHGNSGRMQPTAEAGAVARLTSGRPILATLALQATRFGNATLGDPVREPGWVSRVLLGVRYGR